MSIMKKIFGGQNRRASTGITADTLDAAARRRKLADEEGHFRGKHYTEWVPELNRLRTAGQPAEAEYLALVLECIDAAERASAVMEESPAPGYTSRAAIVYRRRKDYAAEVAIMERWYRAAPPRAHGANDDPDKFTERLAKAQELLDRL